MSPGAAPDAPAPRPPRPVTYWVPRARRRGPVLVVAALALPLLVAGQLAVGQAVTGPGPAGPPTAATTGATTTATSAATTPATTPATTVATTAPTPAATAGPTPPVGPGPDAPTAGEPVDEVRIELAVGAVLDAEATALLDDLVEVLGSPGAAPALVRGNAEPGPDPDAALALARQRADVVVEALVERGVPPELLRVTATVDAEQGRSVVVLPDVP